MDGNAEMNGLVVRTTGSWYNVLTDGGDTFACRLRGNFRIRGSKQTNPIAVGDRVTFDILEDGTGMITDIADRRNCIIRRSTKLSKQTHVIAANIDQLCIVATLGFPRTSTGFIDRLLVTAEAYHIPAVIIFNKCDLYGMENGELRTENGERKTENGLMVRHTPPLCGTPLQEGRKTENGERFDGATHPAAVRHPSPRGEGERGMENGLMVRHTPPLCGTPLREGMADAVGERRTENGERFDGATHPAAVRHPSPRGEGERGMESELWQIHNEIKAIYEGAGYPVYEVSALTGMGLDRIKRLIEGKVTLFSGHSGVGKSALLNAIDPSLNLRVGEVSEWSLKGKHTTTFAEIFPIKLTEDGLTENGERFDGATHPAAVRHPSPRGEGERGTGRSYLIDTPGIKEFGMVDFSVGELSHFFPEMRRVLHNCHFANCTHRHEPGCAVKAAVENGEISAERYQNYLNILESIESDAPIRR